MIEKLIRTEFKNHIPYNANQQPYKIKLDANESPFNLPTSVREKLAQSLIDNPKFNLYPDSDSTELREKIATFWNVDKKGVIVGTGSDQLIQVITNLFIAENDRVLFPSPSFGMYKEACLIAGGDAIEYILDPDKDYNYSKEVIIDIYNKEKPKMIYICNPNNPTGNIMLAEDIIEVVKHCSQSVVIVDEAYGEFCNETAIPAINQYENLIVLRTFSKAYGLAGIRCGYSISSNKMAQLINTVRPPYNVSSFTQFAATLTILEQDELNKNISYLNEQRTWMTEQLLHISGIKVFKSQANFVLVKINECQKVYKKLCEKGILVRFFGTSPLLKDCMRITIGTQEQNSILLDELRSICYNK